MLRIMVLAACGACLLAACSGPAGDEGTSVRGVTDTEIVVGSHSDLSGPAALLGNDLINGARMRFDEVNAAGGIHGRQVRFVVEDSQYQLPKAIQATNKLVNRDNIFVMFLALGTPMNNATIDTLLEAGVPNLFPVSGARQMVEPFRRMMFTARGIYYDEIRAGVRYFVEERGAGAICALYQDTDYGVEILDAVRDQTAAMGVPLVETSAHKPTDTEFTAAVLKLRNAGCDTVMMGTIYKDTLLTFEAARKIGWTDVAFVGQNAAYSKAVAAQESGAAEGYFAFVHMAVLYADDEMNTAERDWFDRFSNAFGREPEYAAQEGYRNADVLVTALQAAGPKLTTDSLIEALESLHTYRDIFGYELTFGPDDHKGVDESVLSTVRDGRWIVLEESVRY